MREELITLETAKLAKEKGFNEYCYGMESFYLILEDLWEQDHHNGDEFLMYEKGKLISSTNRPSHHGVKYQELGRRPTQSLLQKWLREKHNIHLFISIYNRHPALVGEGNEIKYYYVILYHSEYGGYAAITEYPRKTSNELRKVYEEVLEEGLFEALKLIS